MLPVDLVWAYLLSLLCSALKLYTQGWPGKEERPDGKGFSFQATQIARMRQKNRYSLGHVSTKMCRSEIFLGVSETGSAKTGSAIESVSTMQGRYWNSVSAFLLDSLQWRVTWGWVYSLVLEASRQSILNFRIGVPIVDRGGDCRTPVCRPHFRFLGLLSERQAQKRCKSSNAFEGWGTIRNKWKSGDLISLSLS